MHKICTTIQNYAVAPEVGLLCIYMHLYAKKKCKNMQAGRKSYANCAKICSPHFADEKWADKRK